MSDVLKIRPYWADIIRTWVFDDEAAGLVQEPFVSGTDVMISKMLELYEINFPELGFILKFSDKSFVGFQERLSWAYEEMDGNWYEWKRMGMQGWLCPALFCYYDEAPKILHVKMESIPVWFGTGPEDYG